MATTYEELEEDQASLIPDQNELGAIITALKLGTSMTRFLNRRNKNHETKTFQLHLDDFKISWFRAAGREEGKSKYVPR